MSPFELPADDAPAEEWGRLAVSVPDWRYPWRFPHTEVCPPMPGFVLVDGVWTHTDDIDRDVDFRTPVCPDPDHWAWEGWLRRMLGPCEIGHDATDPTCGPWSAEIPGVFRMGTTAGRAMIAAAAANGRWPGGAK